MIESQKQYEETLDFLKINRFAYDEANEIDDLIEALREVARASKHLAALGYNKANVDWRQETLDKLAALPDWIKEDG